MVKLYFFKFWRGSLRFIYIILWKKLTHDIQSYVYYNENTTNLLFKSIQDKVYYYNLHSQISKRYSHNKYEQMLFLLTHN